MTLSSRATKARTLRQHAHEACDIRESYAESHRLAGLSQNLILLANQFADELAGKGHEILGADLRARTQKIVRAKQKGGR
jgi:hypothetical protein